MALNMVKYAVGIDSIQQLESRQVECKKKFGCVFSLTRLAPRRGDEVVAGGSMYWVIKRQIRVRQRILKIEKDTANEGDVVKVRLILDSLLYPTVPIPRRPHQGWRYLNEEQVPADLSMSEEELYTQVPASLVSELRRLGLF